MSTSQQQRRDVRRAPEPVADGPLPRLPQRGEDHYIPEVGFSTIGVTAGYIKPTPRGEEPWDCAEDPNPGHWQPRNERQLRYAQGICGGCARRADCLDLGLTRGESGVWGGVLLASGRPRLRLVRTNASPSAASESDAANDAA